MPTLFELMPDAEIRWCARHLMSNWKKKFRGKEFKKHFWAYVKATNEAQYMQRMAHLAEISNDAHDAMLQNNPKFWCRAFFQTHTTCDLTDNNLCEAFNGIIVPARNNNILTCLEDIRQLVMKRLYTNRDLAQKWVGELGDRKSVV